MTGFHHFRVPAFAPPGANADTMVADRARRGISGALSPEIRFSGAESRSEGLTVGVSASRKVLTAGSCAT